MLKDMLKKLLKDEDDKNVYIPKFVDFEARILCLEKDNAELKDALGNLSIAYLEMIKSLPLIEQSTTQTTQSPEDEYLEQILKSFNSMQNDDDLLN